MKQDNSEQQLSEWTQQLHDKLEGYETPAPEGLWADIEAALAQQPKPQASRFVHSSGSRQPKAVSMAWRRWVAAAAVAALMAGGGYVWWSAGNGSVQQTAEAVQLTAEAVQQTVEAAQQEEQTTQPSPPIAPPRKGRVQRGMAVQEGNLAVNSETVPARRETEPASNETEPAHRETEPAHRETEPARRETEPVHRETEPKQPIFLESERQTVHPSAPTPKPPLTVALYAMNGFGNQTASNGVQMADAMAQQFYYTYDNSLSAARSPEPIYLTGYEEHQHHHQPLSYGLTLSYPITSRLAINTGVVYTKLRSDFTQTMRSQQIQQEQTLHYVGVPVGLSYRLWTFKGFRTYLTAGAKADWNVATHFETEGVTQHLDKDRLQWSLNGSLGVQYDVVPMVGIYAEPGLSWYPDNGSRLHNYFKDKPLNFSLQLGLRLNMK